jgi:5-formyltetrahydrofolate cyclo-ligase
MLRAAPGRTRPNLFGAMDDHDSYQEKCRLRAAAHLRRLHFSVGQQASAAVIQRLTALPEYSAARTVLCYVSFRSEVATRDFLLRMLEEGKRVVVPYCQASHLELLRFAGFDDLTPGMLGILEPKAELRSQEDRRAAVQEIDLFVIPGLAFDRQGGRLGYGKGYFDRLLRDARNDALLAAVAFECQLFDAVPMLPHDVRVDCVVTEAGVYRRTLPRYGAAAKPRMQMRVGVSKTRDDG